MPTPTADSRPYAADDPRNIDFKDFDARVRVMQIIVVALVTGVIFFIGIVVFDFKKFAGQLETLNWLGLAVALAGIPLSVIVPNIISTTQSPALSPSENSSNSAASIYEQKLSLFQVRLIIGCAILEGAAFLNGIAFQQQPHPISLVAAGVCLALMLARFPTKWKVQSWIAARLA